MLKQLSAAVIGLGLIGAQACVAGEVEEEALEVGEVEQGMCYSNDGVNPTLAALAVAMAKEIGELHPVRDLQINTRSWRVELSSTGRSKCNARGSCKNIDALLALQDDRINWTVPHHVFNATNYRNTVFASYQRQKDIDANLARNNPGALPDPHRLEFVKTSNSATCGKHYVFNAFKANCWGSNCVMPDPGDIQHRLGFFENGGNPYLDFYWNERQIGIDPTGVMNGDANAKSGSCTLCATGMAVDPTYKLNNTCCDMNGAHGVFKPYSLVPGLFLCTK